MEKLTVITYISSITMQGHQNINKEHQSQEYSNSNVIMENNQIAAVGTKTLGHRNKTRNIMSL